MKKHLVSIFLALMVTACSNIGESNLSRTTFVNTEKFCKVIIEEESNQIVFKSIDNENLAVDISLAKGDSIKRLFLYDGENLIRIEGREGKLLLKGKQLALFKNMFANNKSIDMKGKIDNYNYFSQKLSKKDTEVIGQIFGENQI